MLVHAEPFADVCEAIAREKALKKWRREWKLRLVEAANPNWRDLFDDLPGREVELDHRLRGNDEA